MANAFDPLYLQREDDPAQHVAVDDDLCDIRLLPDTLEELGALWVDRFIDFCHEQEPQRKAALSRHLDAISAREAAVRE